MDEFLLIVIIIILLIFYFLVLRGFRVIFLLFWFIRVLFFGEGNK